VLEISTDPADYVNSVWFDIEPTLAEAMAMNVRSYLMMRLQDVVRERRWSQRRAAAELGVTQPRICHLMGDRLDRFSTDSLIVLLARAGVDVQIRTKPRGASRAAKRTA
jgi:predicted XRE-type DNA-binding protein